MVPAGVTPTARATGKHLPPQRRATLIRGLEQLLDAGLAVDRSLAILADSANVADRALIIDIEHRLRTGTSLATAGRHAGLFSEVEAAIIGAAEQAGNLERALTRLARLCEEQATISRALKARLALPTFTFLLAALIAPIVDWVAGRYGPGGYLLRAAAFLAVPVAGYAMLSSPVRRSHLASLASSLRLPLVTRLRRDYACRNYLHTLAMALESGLPALQAVQLAAGTLPATFRQGPFSSVARRVMNGAALAEALRDAHLLNEAGFGLVNTGEHAGALDESLTRVVKSLSAAIAEREAAIAIWLPRVAYVAAAVACAAAIASSSGIRP